MVDKYMFVLNMVSSKNKGIIIIIIIIIVIIIIMVKKSFFLESKRPINFQLGIQH